MPEATARTVLLTGFGPFPGIAVNASALLVARVVKRARRRWPDVTFNTALLATEWERGPRRLSRLLAKLQPDVAIHFGVATRAKGFEIETRATNTCAASPDAAGRLPASRKGDAHGPATRRANLPVAAILEALAAADIPVSHSDDAGEYLCNRVLYASLADCKTARARRAGFIHIPACLAGGGNDGRAALAGCPLDWPQAIDGALAIIATTLAAFRP
ncbi:MAG: pyroglutamyl-peptidase I [Hyphomicrobiaceae bacterium]